jgi:hypothetical protein
LTWSAGAYRFLLHWSRILAQLSFVGAAIYAGFQWYSAKVDGRVQQSLNFYEKYNSVPFTQYRSNISKFISSNMEDLKKAGTQQEYIKIFLRKMKDSGIVSDFDILADFYDGLSVCVSAKLCDEDVAAQLFQIQAEGLYNPFFPYVKFVREQNKVKNFALGLEKIRDNPPSTPTFFGKIIDTIF